MYHGSVAERNETASALLETLMSPDRTEIDHDPVRAAIVEAARVELEQVGIRRANIGEVARRAGVSRPTLYRRFADKDALVLAVVSDYVSARFIHVDKMLATLTDPTEILAAFTADIVAGLRRNPLLQAMKATEPEELYRFADVGSTAILGVGRALVARCLAHAEGIVATPAEVDIVAEIIVRLLISVMLMPESIIPLEDDEAVAQFARKYLAPMVTHLKG